VIGSAGILLLVEGGKGFGFWMFLHEFPSLGVVYTKCSLAGLDSSL
jgi:hypothetical protein